MGESPFAGEQLLDEFLAATELGHPLGELGDAVLHVARIAGITGAERGRQPVFQLVQTRACAPPGGAEQHGTCQGGTENSEEHGFVVHAHMVRVGSVDRTDALPRGFKRFLVIPGDGL